MTTFTIAYVTGRRDPMLELFTDSLAAMTEPADQIDLVVIDFYGRSLAELGIAKSVPGVVRARAAASKPTIWQGEHRITAIDYWAMSSARNTALALAATDYVAFLDDRCWLTHGWLPAVRRGARERKTVLVGPYDKFEATGISVDSRSAIAASRKIGINCGGGWLFGGNFALPLAWALQVNGFEEGCDCVGGEDYIFGQMLENTSRVIEFVPSMLVQQDRRGIDHPFPRNDKGISPDDKSHAMNARFGPRSRTEMTPNLVELRAHLGRGGCFPIPDPTFDHRDWYDGQPIREM